MKRETAERESGVSDTAYAPITDFTLDLLSELRASDYHPRGWLRFLRRAWRQTRTTAREHPALVRSWRRVTVALALAEAGALASEAALSGSNDALLGAPGAALCLLATQFDAYAHLGMNQPDRNMPLAQTLGWPNTLTLTRQAAAGLLWGRLLAGRAAGRPALLSALLVGGATDIADGALARRTAGATRLGAYLDSEADFSFWLAVALTLAARGWLPRWLLALLLARWLAPFALALASYFGMLRRTPISSTVVGKAAGVAQMAAMGVALLPQAPERPRAATPNATRRLKQIVYLCAAGLLVAAPLAQAWKLRRGA